jgi:hypothetical protein
MDPWTEAAVKELENRGLQHYMWIGGIGLVTWTVGSAILTWLVTTGLTLAKWRQSGIETQLKSGDVLERIEATRKNLSKQKEQFDILLLELAELLRLKRTRGVKNIRDELCRFHSKEYLDELRHYIESIKIYSSKSDAGDRIEIDIIPALQTTYKFLSVVNHPTMLKKCGDKAPYLLNKRSNKVLFKRLRRMLPFLAIRADISLYIQDFKFMKYRRKFN